MQMHLLEGQTNESGISDVKCSDCRKMQLVAGVTSTSEARFSAPIFLQMNKENREGRKEQKEVREANKEAEKSRRSRGEEDTLSILGHRN